MTPTAHGLVGVTDAGAFLARLTRLDPAALVRLRPATDPEHTVLWARLPWQVLVTRAVRGTGPGDATVAAADLLAVLTDGGDELPPRHDAEWRWPLPSRPGRVAETVTAQELVRVAGAAAGTLRTAVTRPVGERAVRDALLDHVPIVVTRAGEAPVEVPQRLVQAIVRMGFLGRPALSTPESVQVRVEGVWVGLSAPYGTAWLRSVSDFSIRPRAGHPNG